MAVTTKMIAGIRAMPELEIIAYVQATERRPPVHTPALILLRVCGHTQ